MGAHLFYKLVNKKEAKEVMDYICDVSETAKKLKEIKEGVSFGEPADIDWAIENKREDMIPFLQKSIGTGDIKTSGGLSDEAYEKGLKEEDVLELYTQMFEELNERYEIKYYADSCSFTVEGYYFTIEQMKRITQDGKLLSGSSSSSERVVEKYNELYRLLKPIEPKTFDISILKENDKIQIDGEWFKVVDNWRGLSIETRARYIKIEDLADKIEGYQKYIPKCRYSGAVADVESYINDNGKLVFLEIVGQESMVKSITSVLMQGRVKMNDHSVDIPAVGWFDVHKAGNRRKMIDLGNGISHAIVYHSPSIADVGFNILVGRESEELVTQFAQWMEKSQPLPYPKELINEIFAEMEKQQLLDFVKVFQIWATRIVDKVKDNEYQLLQDVILKVCKANGLISSDAKPMRVPAPLPKSPLLTVGQVKHIYDTLKKLPATYQLDGVKIKPVGLKLFTSNMTWYVVEAEKGNLENEEQGFREAFGYVENLSFPEGSEWGYFNIDEIVKCGAEMDLYFEDKFITQSGEIVNNEKEVA